MILGTDIYQTKEVGVEIIITYTEENKISELLIKNYDGTTSKIYPYEEL